MKNLHLLEKGDIKTTLLKMSLPMIIAQLISLINNMTDRYFVSHFISQDAFTAVGVGFPILLVIFAFINLFVVGTPSLYSRALGEKNFKKASEIKHGTMIISSVLLILLSLGILSSLRALLFKVGATNNTIDDAVAYNRWIFGGIVIIYYSIIFTSFIRSEGHSNLSMFILIFGAVFNIVLDYLFVVVFHMGVRGAAIATIMSQFSSAFIGFIAQANSKVVKFELIKTLNMNVEDFVLSLKISIGAFLNPFLISAFNIVINGEIKRLGIEISEDFVDKYIAITSLIAITRGLIIAPLIGVASGISPLMSYNYGAGDKKRVLETLVWGFIYSFAIVAPFWISLSFFPQLFTSLFNIAPDNIENTKRGVFIAYIMIIIFAFAFAAGGFFQATGQYKLAIAGSVVPNVLSIVAVYIIVYFFGIKNIWYSFPFSYILSFSFSVVFLFLGLNSRTFRNHFNKRIETEFVFAVKGR